METLNKQKPTSRETKYCKSIKDYLSVVGHATNAEILNALRKSFPELSATTVHRATNRLSRRGEIAMSPPDSSGSFRFDNNISSHDHFMCSLCSNLKDVNIIDDIKEILESKIEGCKISGRLTISGICRNCKVGEIK